MIPVINPKKVNNQAKIPTCFILFCELLLLIIKKKVNINIKMCPAIAIGGCM